MEHGVVWEEFGGHFIVGETGAQRKEELRLEAGAWDHLAQRNCACMCVGAAPPLRPGGGTFRILTPWSGPRAGVELCHSIRDTPPL